MCTVFTSAGDRFCSKPCCITKYDRKGSVMKPTIKSAVAKFTTNQLNRVRRFLFGLRATAYTMRILLGILVRIKTILIIEIANGNSFGG